MIIATSGPEGLDCSPRGDPTVGQIMASITAGEFDGATYDANYPQRIIDTIY